MQQIITQKNSKLIRISDKTYKQLAEKGTLEDSFDSVIQRLLNQKEV